MPCTYNISYDLRTRTFFKHAQRRQILVIVLEADNIWLGELVLILRLFLADSPSSLKFGMRETTDAGLSKGLVVDISQDRLPRAFVTLPTP